MVKPKYETRMLHFFKSCLLVIGIVLIGIHSSVYAQQKLKDTKKQRTFKSILFLGNSLTAGYGLGIEQAFPNLIQHKIDSLGWKYHVMNAGLSGETTAGGLRRVDWLLTQKVDVLVLELGGNDALRGIDLQSTKNNLQKIIDRIRAKYPHVRIIIAGMLAPPNLGAVYIAKFKAIFPDLAVKNKAALIPFLLEDVAGIPELNQPDGMHPNVRGHKIVAENVWEVLKKIIGQ